MSHYCKNNMTRWERRASQKLLAMRTLLSASMLLLSLLPHLACSFQIQSISTTTTRAHSSGSNRRLSNMVLNPDSFASDDEWHPVDPAYTIPQLLTGIWHQIAQAGTMVKGESMTVLYPQMEEELQKATFLNVLFAHLDVCKDVCDHFGITTSLVPYRKGAKIVGFTSKSFQTANQLEQETNDGGDYEFGYDPMWDDGTDFESLYKDIDDEYEDASQQQGSAVTIPIENKIPSDDDEIIDITKKWVGKMMSDMGICPFSQNADSAGLPLGKVFYCVDRSDTVEDVYSRYWKEVVRVEQNKEKDLSTSLLILPEFYMDNVELFESFSTTLTNALTILKVEDLLQLVFFHPDWSFRDGASRASAGSDDMAANYARRSPWPMINLLRTSQVRAAQKGIPTGLVYKQNEKTLAAVGVQKLETMLRLRDWSDIADFTVNRREFDALKIAQDFQATGKVSRSDMSLEHDATPAANKVDRKQVEEGDLITVLLQALGKRLGKVEGQPIQPLSGPETSASAMAGDFLIQELDRYAAAPPAAAVAAPVVTKEPETPRDRRQEQMEAARKALMADLMETEERQSGQADDRGGDPMADILFGKGGIPDKRDERWGPGMDPDSFY